MSTHPYSKNIFRHFLELIGKNDQEILCHTFRLNKHCSGNFSAQIDFHHISSKHDVKRNTFNDATYVISRYCVSSINRATTTINKMVIIIIA